MVVGIGFYNIRVSYVNSLKEKRSITMSIKNKLKNKYNISISEIESNDNHKNIGLGVSTVSNSKNIVEKTLNDIIVYIEENYNIDFLDEEIIIDNY
ncbi:MAG: DUF503 domain-containing protein [Clostridium sp.]|nr:DUF503 domain-containing protein [Clostridium sp.]